MLKFLKYKVSPTFRVVFWFCSFIKSSKKFLPFKSSLIFKISIEAGLYCSILLFESRTTSPSDKFVIIVSSLLFVVLSSFVLFQQYFQGFCLKFQVLQFYFLIELLNLFFQCRF